MIYLCDFLKYRQLVSGCTRLKTKTDLMQKPKTRYTDVGWTELFCQVFMIPYRYLPLAICTTLDFICTRISVLYHVGRLFVDAYHKYWYKVTCQEQYLYPWIVFTKYTYVEILWIVVSCSFVWFSLNCGVILIRSA